MGRWSIIAGSMQLLMLIALSVDMAHITSRSTTHQMCSDDEYYDADRDSCFDLCRGKKCLPHPICTERNYGHQGPYICGDLCFQTCTLPMYCNTETAYCNPCSNICNYLDKDMLRQCRIHCYDIYKNIAASGFQTSTAPLTTTDSLSIIGPICLQNEYYDAEIDMCLDLCGKSKCQPHQISAKVGGYTGPHFCVVRCKPTCDSPLYCSKETGKCEPCLDICNDQNEESLRQCEIYCYDIYEEMVVSPTSTAAPLASTSSEPPPTYCYDICTVIGFSRTSAAGPRVSTCTDTTLTSDESIQPKQKLVSKPNYLVPVVSYSLAVFATALCMRICRVKQTRGEPQRTIGTASLMSNTPAMKMARWSIMVRTLQLLMLVALSVDMAYISSQSITNPMCGSDEYYDADRDACADMCGESKCQTYQKCSQKIPSYTWTHHRCLDLCYKPCASPWYCNIKTAHCDPCDDICNDHNEDTLRQCRKFCLDVYKEIVVSHASTAAPMVSTSSEPPPTSDESITIEQIPVSESTQLSPGLVAVYVLVLVVICGVLLAVITLCVRRRRLLQRTGGPLPAGEDIPLISKELYQYMTQLKESYGQQINERNEMEKKQYRNVIPLDQHQPVIINHGLKAPVRQQRRTYDKFVIEQSDREQLTLENFLHDNGHGRPRSVLMLGGPGMGKTSICYTILDWFVKGRWNDHQYIFFISLKELESMATSVSLADILFDYTKALYNRENKETLFKQVKEREKETLILLDGYDECEEFMTDQLDVSDPTAKAKPGSILKNLVRGNMLLDAQVLLTSRPFKSINVDLGFERVVQLAGLTAKSVLTLLKNQMVLPTIPNDICSLLSIPINLQKFLTWINSKHSTDKFPRTKTSLCSVQMIPVLRQTFRFIDFNPITELEMWNRPEVLRFLRSLAKLASTAFDGLDKKQVMFQSHELEKCGLDENIVKQGGLMTSFTKSTQEHDEMGHVVHFYFIHLTYLEWVGGLHIVNTTLDYIRGLIRRNQGQLDVILSFAVGLLGDKDGQMILKRVHSMSPKRCQVIADQILSDIVHSERCTSQKSGCQYALEVYHEGQFTRPHLLLPLLVPDGHELVLTDAAHCNRHVVHYFLSQLIASQDGQSEQAEEATEISNIDSMILHFAEEADVTVQEDFLEEVGRLKKLKYLSIKADGAYEAAVEQPLELLTVQCDIGGDEAAHIIENSRASVLCLFSNKLMRSFSANVQPVVKELHLALFVCSAFEETLEGTNNLSALTGLLYDEDIAPTTLRLIEMNSELQAIGLDVRTIKDSDSAELTRVLKSCKNIRSIVLNFEEFTESHSVMTLAILNELTSLQEIWLTFLWSVPNDNQLANLGQKVCIHTRLNSVSLLSDRDFINVSAFLEVLSDKKKRLSSVYINRRCQPKSDLVNRTTGSLVYVKDEFESMHYTPLVYSQYLLTSVPSHTKDALRKRYVSLQK